MYKYDKWINCLNSTISYVLEKYIIIKSNIPIIYYLLHNYYIAWIEIHQLWIIYIKKILM